jgi:hypothetical protein
MQSKPPLSKIISVICWFRYDGGGVVLQRRIETRRLLNQRSLYYLSHPLQGTLPIAFDQFIEQPQQGLDRFAPACGAIPRAQLGG